MTAAGRTTYTGCPQPTAAATTWTNPSVPAARAAQPARRSAPRSNGARAGLLQPRGQLSMRQRRKLLRGGGRRPPAPAGARQDETRRISRITGHRQARSPIGTAGPRLAYVPGNRLEPDTPLQLRCHGRQCLHAAAPQARALEAAISSPVPYPGGSAAAPARRWGSLVSESNRSVGHVAFVHHRQRPVAWHAVASDSAQRAGTSALPPMRPV